MRDPSDPLYDPTILEHRSELETLLGEIRMILFTKQGDIMGNFNFGYNLEDQLFLFNIDQAKLQSQIMDAINTYCPDAQYYAVSVDVQFFQGSVRDACLIDIYIDAVQRLGILIK